jgi:Domain of unknown function (DUF4214)
MLEVSMRLKIILGLVITAGLMMGCGTTTTPTPEAQGSKPTTTRAQSYNANFAQKYVDLVARGYSVTRLGWYGLEAYKTSAVTNLTNGQTTPSRLRDSFLDQLLGFNLYGESSNSDLQSPENYVLFLWRHYLLNDGDAPSRGYWVNRLLYGMTPSQVRDVFIDTPEYAYRFPNDQFVASLYTNILRRSASPGEIQAWANFLNAGGTSRSNAIRLFLDSAEFSSCQLINPYATYDILFTRVYVDPRPLPGPLTPYMRCN